MLDLDHLSDRKLHRDPFSWAFIDKVFESKAITEELRNTLPASGFIVRDTGESGVVRGGYKGQTFVENGEVTDAGEKLPEVWRGLVHTLLSSSYLDAMSDLTGLNLKRCKLDVRLSRYGPGHWLEPHTDNPEHHMVTRIIYFNELWETDWGGCLRILRSNDVDDVAYEISPLLDTSVVLVRSDDSWHAVTPLKEGIDQERFRFIIRVRAPD